MVKKQFISKKFCNVCGVWFQPEYRGQKKCNECKIRIRPRKSRIQPSEELKALYEKYGL